LFNDAAFESFVLEDFPLSILKSMFTVKEVSVL